MTTYNTGNPVPSADLKDLHDNAEVMDDVVNSSSDTTTDRTGRTILTLSGMSSAAGDATIAIDAATSALASAVRAENAADAVEADATDIATAAAAAAVADVAAAIDGDADRAEDAANAAEASATAAEVSANAALAASNTYADTNAGLAATVDGDLFLVATSDPQTFELYENDTGSAVLRGEVSIIGRNNLPPNLWVLADNPAKKVLEFDNERRELLYLDHGLKKLVAYGVPLGGGAGGGAAVLPVAQLPTANLPILTDWNASVTVSQSLGAGATAQPAASLLQPYSNRTFTAGPKASKAGSTGGNPGTGGTKPLVEDNLAADGGTDRGETHCSGLANGAVEYYATENGGDPNSLVIFASTSGHGGYTLSQIDFGSSWSQVFKDHVTELAARAADAVVTARIHCIPFIQGESDTGAPGNYATYKADLVQFQADCEDFVQANLNGDAVPVPFQSYQTASGSVTNDGDVAMAQLDACRENPELFRFVTATYHMPRTDGTHLNQVGYKWMGRHFGRDLKRFLIDGLYADYVKPVSATIRGNVVSVRFECAYPLTLDSDTLAATVDSGFVVHDDGAPVAINSVVVVNGRTVEITLGAAPSGVVQVRYALDNLGAGLTINNGASGNLRDTDPDVWTYEGVDYPMYRVAPAFKLTAIELEA